MQKDKAAGPSRAIGILPRLAPSISGCRVLRPEEDGAIFPCGSLHVHADGGIPHPSEAWCSGLDHSSSLPAEGLGLRLMSQEGSSAGRFPFLG